MCMSQLLKLFDFFFFTSILFSKPLTFQYPAPEKHGIDDDREHLYGLWQQEQIYKM